MKILKYPVAEKVSMPLEAEIVEVAFDLNTGAPAIWALVDPDLPSIERSFIAVKTGQDIPETEALKHVATLILRPDGGKALVTHILEITPSPATA